MRVAAVLPFCLAIAASSEAATHHYSASQRYAGCLFGEAVPLMRHGMDREHALAAASDRCIGWSTNLTAGDIRQVDLDLHRAIEDAQRQGL